MGGIFTYGIAACHRKGSEGGRLGGLVGSWILLVGGLGGPVGAFGGLVGTQILFVRGLGGLVVGFGGLAGTWSLFAIGFGGLVSAFDGVVGVWALFVGGVGGGGSALGRSVDAFGGLVGRFAGLVDARSSPCATAGAQGTRAQQPVRSLSTRCTPCNAPEIKKAPSNSPVGGREASRPAHIGMAPTDDYFVALGGGAAGFVGLVEGTGVAALLLPRR
jgi:hypothetical protein